MRTWGRVNNTGPWVLVQTDAQGNNDAVWLTTLAQCLLLGLGEDPFFGNYGIPAQQSAVTDIFPDYYVTITQQQFAQYFASLIISRVAGSTINGAPPVYNVDVVTNQGVALPTVTVPI